MNLILNYFHVLKLFYQFCKLSGMLGPGKRTIIIQIEGRKKVYPLLPSSVILYFVSYLTNRYGF